MGISSLYHCLRFATWFGYNCGRPLVHTSDMIFLYITCNTSILCLEHVKKFTNGDSKSLETQNHVLIKLYVKRWLMFWCCGCFIVFGAHGL